MPNYKIIEDSVQHRFYNSRAQIQIFGGGFGNGKTASACIKAIKLAKDYPGSNGLIARETYPKLNDTIRKEFFKWCPPGAILKRPTQDDNTCYMKNGSIINFRYISQRGRSREDGTSTSNLLSATYDWIIVDQMEDPGIIYKDFLDLIGRLRGDTAYRSEDEDESMPLNGPQWFIITVNPTHGWVYKELVQPYLIWQKTGTRHEKLIVDADTKMPILELFESATYDNRINVGDKYIKRLEALYKGQQRDRYLLGKWVAFEGLVYPDYESLTHTITREFAEQYLLDCLSRNVQIQGIEGYDFGLASPSCYLLAFVDDKGRVIVMKGFYESNFGYDLQIPEIKKIRSEYAGLIRLTERIKADPSIFKRTVVAGKKDTGTTVAKLFEEEGIYMQPASNDIYIGIPKVASYLSGKAGIPHLVTGEDHGPLIYFVDDLEFIDTEFSSYFWKQSTTGERIDEPLDSNDHAMDTLKYMLSKLPEVSSIVVPRDQIPPKWLFWHEVDEGQRFA